MWDFAKVAARQFRRVVERAVDVGDVDTREYRLQRCRPFLPFVDIGQPEDRSRWTSYDEADGLRVFVAVRDPQRRHRDALVERDWDAVLKRHQLDVLQLHELVPRSVVLEELARARHRVDLDRMRAE